MHYFFISFQLTICDENTDQTGKRYMYDISVKQNSTADKPLNWQILLWRREPNVLLINEPPHDKTNKMACAPSKDSDQPGYLSSLIRVFTVRMKKAWILSYPCSTYQRLWSDWADAQADLSLRWAYRSFCWFCHVEAQMSHITRKSFCIGLQPGKTLISLLSYRSLQESWISGYHNQRQRITKMPIRLHGCAGWSAS